jgi:large subunit ribosomal protein L21
MKYIIASISGSQFLFKDKNWYDINNIKKKTNNSFLTLERILLLKNGQKMQIGKPFLNQFFITGLIMSNVFGKKIKILKTKPKKNYTRLKGYRPEYTRIYISN